MEVPIVLSEDCYCNPSVPTPNGQTLGTHNGFIDGEYKMLKFNEPFKDKAYHLESAQSSGKARAVEVS